MTPHKFPALFLLMQATQDGGAIHGKLLINGRWSLDENTNHINYLELLAIKLAIKSFRGTLSNHVRIMSDNATAICINKMGGHKIIKV